MLKSWIYNGSKKLWFQQEVSKSRTMDPNVAPVPQKKINTLWGRETQKSGFWTIILFDIEDYTNLTK